MTNSAANKPTPAGLNAYRYRGYKIRKVVDFRGFATGAWDVGGGLASFTSLDAAAAWIDAKATKAVSK